MQSLIFFNSPADDTNCVCNKLISNIKGFRVKYFESKIPFITFFEHDCCNLKLLNKQHQNTLKGNIWMRLW